MTDPPMGTPAEKLAALNERLKGPELLALLNIKSGPAPDVLVRRVNDLREVVMGLCSHLAPDDPVRAAALERLKGVERLLQDPFEWHILSRASELRQDVNDPAVHALIEAGFFEEHVPRMVWLSAPPDGGNADLRKSMRLPVAVGVELDAGAGNRVRCHTLNLSRDGVCLDLPAGFNAGSVSMVLDLTSTGVKLPVTGDVMWREGVRAGVSFKIGVNERNAIDAALRAHFADLSRAVDRWRQVAPHSAAALACAHLIGYASSALPSTRREHLDKLAAAAEADRGQKELQLALAKLHLEEGEFDNAATVLKRVVVADRADARWRLLDQTLAQRTGRRVGGGGGPIGGPMQIAIAALLGVGLVVAVGFAVVSMQQPLKDAPVPSTGLRCTQLQIVQTNALCTMDSGAYARLAPGDKARLAKDTLHALDSYGVSFVTVYGSHDEGVLDTFSRAVLDAVPPRAP